MKNKQKSIYTVKVTYNADITLTVESDNADDAIRLASEKAKTADNSEFNIYDERDVSILNASWQPDEHGNPAAPLPGEMVRPL